MLPNQVHRPGRHWLYSAALFIVVALLIMVAGAFESQNLLAAALEAGSVQSMPGKLAVVGAQGADVYDAPDGGVVDSLTPGDTLNAVGRTADNQWILVYQNDEPLGWVEALRLVVFGADQLPMMAPESPTTGETPVAEPTQAATRTGATPTRAATTAAATPTQRPATATPLPTHTPSPTPLPTNTPTPTLTPSPTPLPTNTPTTALVAVAQSEVIAVVGADGADLVSEPQGQSLQALPIGAALTVGGRSQDGLWLYVTTNDGASGWVESARVVAFNVRNLPVMGESEEVAATAPITDTASSETAQAATAAALLDASAAPTDTATSESSTPVATAIQVRRPTPAADGRTTARVAMTGSRLNVRSGPGVEYGIIAKALPNEVFIVLGHDEATTWVQLELPEAPDGFGWVSVNFVELSDPVADLPVSTATSSAPAPLPTPTATAAAVETPTAEETPAAVTSTVQPVVQRTAPNAAPAGLSGQLVIQSAWGGAFYLYDLTSGAFRLLSGGFDPALSPDGTQVAFTRQGTEGGVFLINTDGGNERKIFGERSGLRSPKWSPDGKWIVFSRSDGEYKCYDLGFGGFCFSADELRSNVPNIEFDTPPGCDAECQAQIDQQEDQLEEEIKEDVVDESKAVRKPNWMIARISATGGDYRDLAALNSARAPDWNEAGIVYQSSNGLQKTADKGDAETQRIYFDYNIMDPDWQPGGGQVVFQMKQGSHWEIFTVNADGSGVSALTRPATTLVDQLPSNVAPAWSPDGQQIVFLSNREPDDEAGEWRVWVMNADGSNQRALPVNLPITYNYASEQMVDWGR